MNYSTEVNTKLNTLRLEPRAVGFENVVKRLDPSVPTPRRAGSPAGRGGEAQPIRQQSGESHEGSRLLPYSSHTAATLTTVSMAEVRRLSPYHA